MRDYPILINLLIGEACVLCILLIMILIHRTTKTFSDKWEKTQQEVLSNFFLSLLETKKPFDSKNFIGSKISHQLILKVLEGFNGHLESEEWTNIRHGVTESFLLPRARKWVKSIFWIKRCFAARTFSLYSLPVDENIILKLVQDKNFLVRSPAASALVYQESRLGIEKILNAMNNEPGYTQFLYRDILLKGSPKVLGFIIELAATPQLHISALETLGAKSWGGTIPFLNDDLNSQDPLVRYLALKVLIRNLIPDSLSHFQKGIVDPDPKVRAVAFQGMGLFSEDQLLGPLEKGLSDSDWEVRVEAGKVLKQKGDQGLQILNRQQEGITMEAAQYVLKFG